MAAVLTGQLAAPAAPDWGPAGNDPRIRWVDLLVIDEIAVRQQPSGEVLGIRHRWEPRPLYDIWVTMDREWFARQDVSTSPARAVLRLHGPRLTSEAVQPGP